MALLKDGLKNKKSLKDVNLNFAMSPKLDDKAFKDLSDAIKGLPALKDLVLILAATPVSDNSVKELAEYTKKLSMNGCFIQNENWNNME